MADDEISWTVLRGRTELQNLVSSGQILISQMFWASSWHIDDEISSTAALKISLLCSGQILMMRSAKFWANWSFFYYFTAKKISLLLGKFSKAINRAQPILYNIGSKALRPPGGILDWYLNLVSKFKGRVMLSITRRELLSMFWGLGGKIFCQDTEYLQ